MDIKTDYIFADLNAQQLDKLKETEEILKRVSGEDVVLIAYQKLH